MSKYVNFCLMFKMYQQTITYKEVIKQKNYLIFRKERRKKLNLKKQKIIR